MNIEQVFSVANSMAAVEASQARASLNAHLFKSAVDSEKEAL